MYCVSRVARIVYRVQNELHTGREGEREIQCLMMIEEYETDEDYETETDDDTTNRN